MRRLLIALGLAACLLAPGCYPDAAADAPADLRVGLGELGLYLDEALLEPWQEWLDARGGYGRLAQALEFDLDPVSNNFYLDLELVDDTPGEELVLLPAGEVGLTADDELRLPLALGECRGCRLALLLFWARTDAVSTLTGRSDPFDITPPAAHAPLEIDAYPAYTGAFVLRPASPVPGTRYCARDVESGVRFPPASFPAAAGELELGSIPWGRAFQVQVLDGAGAWQTVSPELTLESPGQRLLVPLD